MSDQTVSQDELEIDEIMEENEVMMAYDIASYPSDLTLSGIKEMWENKDIYIPEFQRNFVWDIKQSSLLIESFLIGLPVPQVFFYVDENSKNLVIDGQQRIMSLIYFFEGYFGDESTIGKRQVFRLQGLDEKSPYYNKKFSELIEDDQRKLKSRVLRAINIRQLSPKGEKTCVYHIFERLNTGGTPLKPQEIRNCVFRGGFIEVLRTLNNDKNWRKILGKTNLDKHQKDIELLLRVFSLCGAWNAYEKPMKEYLNISMEKHKSGVTKKVEEFKDNFIKATKLVIEQLGEKPFHVRGPLNTSALDSVLCTIIDNYNAIPPDLKNRYQILLTDAKFKEATFYGTSDASVLKARFEKTKTILVG